MPVITKPGQPVKRSLAGRRLVAVCCVALAVGVTAGLVALAQWTDPVEARALRTPGAIVAVTRGDEPLVLGTAWQKWLLRRYPALAPRIGGFIALPQGGSAGDIVVWRQSRSLISSKEVREVRTLRDDRGNSWVVEIHATQTPYITYGPPGRNLVMPMFTFPIRNLPSRAAAPRLYLKDYRIPTSIPRP